MMYIYFNESCLTVQNADDIDKIERSIHDYNESGKSKMIYLEYKGVDKYITHRLHYNPINYRPQNKESWTFIMVRLFLLYAFMAFDPY